MKTSLLFAVISFCAAIAFGAEGVNTDFYSAKESAKKENKLVMLVITRPATCSLCVLFKKNILDNSSFKGFAKKNLIIVTVEMDANNKLVVQENEQAQNKAWREFSQKYSEYKLLPGIFIADPQTDRDTFIKSPKVAKMKASAFIAEIKDFQRDLKKPSPKR